MGSSVEAGKLPRAAPPASPSPYTTSCCFRLAWGQARPRTARALFNKKGCCHVLVVSSSSRALVPGSPFLPCSGHGFWLRWYLVGAETPSRAAFRYRFPVTAWPGFVALGGKPVDNHQSRDCLSWSERQLWQTQLVEHGWGSSARLRASCLSRRGAAGATQRQPRLAVASGRMWVGLAAAPALGAEEVFGHPHFLRCCAESGGTLRGSSVPFSQRGLRLDR